MTHHHNPQSSKIIVLWVRHCISCSNVAKSDDIEQKYRKEPLCTSEGIMHAIFSGNQISKFIQTNFPNKKVKVFSSFLPRAMETAKIISSELIDSGIIDEDDKKESQKIKRLPFISEFWSNYEIRVAGRNYSTSTTTRERSDAHANFLNSFLPQTGLVIDVDEDGDETQSLLEIKSECPISDKERRCKVDMKNSYSDFLRYFVLENSEGDVLSFDKINIIVSHGAFMEKYIVNRKQIPKQMQTKNFFVDNVDSALVEYSLGGEIDGRNKVVEQKLLHYLKSTPSSAPSALERRILHKINSYEFKKILNSKFANCEYTYDDICDFSG